MNKKFHILYSVLAALILTACTSSTPTTAAPTSTPEPPPTESPSSTPTEELPEPEVSNVQVAIHTIHMFNAGTGWAIGQTDDPTDLILFTNDGGATWMDVSPPEAPSPGTTLEADAAFIDPQHAWVVYTGSSNVWSTVDAGATWSPAPALPSGVMGARFFALDNQNGWLLRSIEAGMSQVWEALFHTSSSGEMWSKLFDPNEESSFANFSKTGWDFADTRNGWMTHDSHGVSASVFFQKTGDGGQTWQNIELTPPPDQPDLFDRALCHTHSPNLESSNSGMVALYCKTVDPELEFSYLYTTSDGGNTWSVLSYPGGDLYYLHDNTIIATGITITKSVDGGEHWELLDDLEWDAEYDIVSEDIIFATFENEGNHFLCKTMDGCQNWTCPEQVLVTETEAAQPEETEPVAGLSGEFAYISYRSSPENFDTSDLFLASLSDTEPTRLTDSSSYIDSFDWDPAGNIIVLSSDLDGDQDLYLMQLDTGDWEQLTRNDTRDILPAFSPDGRLIAYVQGERGSEEIHLLDLSLQAERFLAAGTTPAWLPDGDRLLVFRQFDGLYEVDVESGEENLLIDSTENGFDYYPSYSPSGMLLMAASNRHSPGDFLVEAPYLYETDGTVIGRIGTVWGSPPYAWLPDGSGLLITSDFMSLGKLQILYMDGTSESLPLADPSGWFPRFRP